MKRIIFLTEQPLNNWNYERFGIDIFLDNNFLVEYWVWGKRENPESQIYDKKIKFFYCKSLTEIKNYVKKTEPFYYLQKISDLTGEQEPDNSLIAFYCQMLIETISEDDQKEIQKLVVF